MKNLPSNVRIITAIHRKWRKIQTFFTAIGKKEVGGIKSRPAMDFCS
jgi:hypothetical protein